jgi:hypothetical protein
MIILWFCTEQCLSVKQKSNFITRKAGFKIVWTWSWWWCCCSSPSPPVPWGSWGRALLLISAAPHFSATSTTQKDIFCHEYKISVNVHKTLVVVKTYPNLLFFFPEKSWKIVKLIHMKVERKWLEKNKNNSQLVSFRWTELIIKY